MKILDMTSIERIKLARRFGKTLVIHDKIKSEIEEIMTNAEIIEAFRAQDVYVKFSDFLENCIVWEGDEDEVSNRD